MPATADLDWCEIPFSVLETALAQHTRAVLEAPPGAGKSTAVPLALLDAPWLGGRRIVMLQPRRLAARAVAARMAALLGQPIGRTVGYRTRTDQRVGPDTRIEVVTEGILTRRLQHDPELSGAGLVIFDEFHERNLQADLGLALTLDLQRNLLPELRLLVMSATLDGAAVAALLDDAPLIRVTGRSHPVETVYAPRSDDRPLPVRVAGVVRHALSAHSGDILVFLPGAGEIRRTSRLLSDSSLPAATDLLPLFGNLSRAEQNRAIAPSPADRRKIVLATNIAETSLTIEGVRVVIDSGLERRSRYDPATGMSRLETVRIAQDSAEQRRGRAGRLAPGNCYRLWTESEHRSLIAHAPAEIIEADLAPLALELACWGTPDGTELTWLDPPPAAGLASARDVLQRLGALSTEGRITTHGRAMAELGSHPRLAHLLLHAAASGQAGTGCALAALLSERDPWRGDGMPDADLRNRLSWLAEHRDTPNRHPALEPIRRTLRLFARRLGSGSADLDPEAAGWLLAQAYPDRIGRRRSPDSHRYLLSGGRGAMLADTDPLARAAFIVAAELDDTGREARIRLAAPLALEDIRTHCADRIVHAERVYWDARQQTVIARREERLDALLLSEQPLAAPSAEAVLRSLLEGIRSMGPAALPWDRSTRQWQARVQLLREHDRRHGWPDVSDPALLDSLEDWLGPWLGGCSRREHLNGLDLAAILNARLDPVQQQRLRQLAPTHIPVPSGSRIAIDYLDGPLPVLSVRLQEVFGLTATPTVVDGAVPVVLKLLSPARRPVQTTRDLAGFWRSTYHEVRKELKGRYPKHYWPDDPHRATPTRGLRPR